jgi:penicillin-binding protein 1A
MKAVTYTLHNIWIKLIVLSFLSFLIVLSSLNLYIDSKLPDESGINEIELKIPLKIFTADKKLIGEFGEERRTALKFNSIPSQYVNAVLAAEDDNFFNHSGVSYSGLVRSVYRLLLSGRVQGGGSTITMQVAGNYLTSRDVNIFRKIKDIFLAYRLEDLYSKEEIFEFYVNRIFFGNRAYGIAAASEVYYGSSLNDLNLAQWAMIASLPKAPSAVNPIINPKRALIRRNWILGRMLELSFIYKEQYDLAIKAPITASYHGLVSEVSAPYLAETIRRQMIKEYGLDAYKEGYEVYTTLDSKKQNTANKAVKNGLEDYDKRHGFREPENYQELFPKDFFQLTLEERISLVNLNDKEQLDYRNIDLFFDALALLESLNKTDFRFPGIILGVENSLKLLTFDKGIIELSWSKELSWARPYINENRRGPRPKQYSDFLKGGDLVWVQEDPLNRRRFLTQIPEAQSALVALNPNTGSIEALVGGYDFYLSKFNRASQSAPLLGSNFKPFLYAAALSSNFTASNLINDAPIVFDDIALEDKWRPKNASGKFYGPTRLREGLLQSRNLVSIRLLRDLGIEKTRSFSEKFGFDKTRLPADLSLALGTASLSPLDNAVAYSVFANGGKKIVSYFIEKVVDRSGAIIFQKNNTELFSQAIDGRVAFIIKDILQEAGRRGTAKKISELERSDFSGKTGTTNDAESTWFTGFNDNLVTTVWVGFDQPKSLGNREFGSSVALPIWMEFIESNTEDIPLNSSLPPAGLVVIKIDPKTGERLKDGSKEGIFEYYLQENTP